MRVLLAPTAFGGSLTARQAAEAMAAGWASGAPHDEVLVLPLGDGEAGFVDVVTGVATAYLGERGAPYSARRADVELVPVTVRDPFGRAVPATIAVTDSARGLTAYVEASDAIGAHLMAAHERAALRGTSAGVGDLLLAALDLEVARVVVGLGEGVALDGGAGVLAALGVNPDELGCGARGLDGLRALDPGALKAARARCASVELVVATDLERGLLGFHGLAATRGELTGATAVEAQHLETLLGGYVDKVTAALGRRDLLTGRALRVDKEAGAGAGGGVGFALLALGATRVSATEEVLTATGVRELLQRCDLVVTGEGRFDWESLREGVVKQVATLAAEVAVPVIVVAGESQVGRREAMSLGLAGSYALGERPDEIRSAMADPVRSLTGRLTRVARTWSPAP